MNEAVAEEKVVEEKIKNAFREFMGSLGRSRLSLDVHNVTQLQDFAFSLGYTWTDETCKSVIEKLDTKNDGSIEIEAFARFVSSGGAQQASQCQRDVLTQAMLGTALFFRAAQRKTSEIIQNISSAKGQSESIVAGEAHQPNAVESCQNLKSEPNTTDLHSGIPMSQTRVRM